VGEVQEGAREKLLGPDVVLPRPLLHCICILHFGRAPNSHSLSRGDTGTITFRNFPRVDYHSNHFYHPADSYHRGDWHYGRQQRHSDHGREF
jgi:hypothetical protein